MKQFVLDLIGSFFDRVCEFFRSYVGHVFFPALTGIYGFFRFVMWGVSSVTAYFNTMIANASSVSGTAVSLNGGTMLGIANFFVPLDKMFYCASLLLTLWISACVYRLIKSWIPTLS